MSIVQLTADILLVLDRPANINEAWGVTVPHIPGCFSTGGTMQEALDNVMEAIKELPEATEDMLKGISCFICGNDSLVKELENGTFEEVKDALEVCFSMMDISAFQCVSSMRNVSMLAARPKQ